MSLCLSSESNLQSQLLVPVNNCLFFSGRFSYFYRVKLYQSDSLVLSNLRSICLLFMFCWMQSDGAVEIEKNAVWRFYDSPTSPGNQWNKNSFNDFSWKKGAAELGFGDSPATYLASGRTTYYFRKKITLYNAVQYSAFTVNIRRDDGVVVYLNGAEVFRDNLPSGVINSSVQALNNCSDDGGGVLQFVLLPSQFMQGENLLAVEVHNSSPADTDLTFELELTSQLPAQLPVLIRGPYLQSVNASSAIFRWRTDVPTDSKVVFGEGSQFTNTVIDTVMTTEHEVKVSGLFADRRYGYKLGSTAFILQAGNDNYFYTAPLPGSVRPVYCWALGDFGNGSQEQQAVLQSYLNYMDTMRNDVWLWLGDNAYNSGTDQEYSDYVFQVYEQVFRHWNFFPALGNHDYGQSGYLSPAALGTTFPYFDIFHLPRFGEVGGVSSGTEKYYSYDYANIHFITLDSYGAYNFPGSPMYEWLKIDLRRNKLKWVIVNFHHPPFSKGSHDSDTEIEMVNMRLNVVPLLEKYGVDLVLTGHSHTYERSAFMHGHYGLEESFVPENIVQQGLGDSQPYLKDSLHNGTVYAVCGVGGKTSASLMNGYPHNAMVSSFTSVSGSLALMIHGDTLFYKFLKSDGTIADEFSMVKTVDASFYSDDESAEEMIIFPNPAKTIVHIDPGTEDCGILTFYDQQGRVVNTSQVCGKQEIDLRKFQAGVYALEFKSSSKLCTAQLVIN